MKILLLLALLQSSDDLPRLIDQLASDDLETRDAAQRRLEEAGPKAKDALKKALAAAKGDHAARIKSILDKLPKLDALVSTTKKKHRVGEDLGLQVRLKNLSDETVVVVGSLDGSDAGMRYPRLTVEIRNEKGELMKPDPVGRCGNTNAPRAKDFVELASGKEFDPYSRVDGYGFFGCLMMDWKPKAPGRYSVTFTYDTSAKEYAQWAGWGSARAPDDDTRNMFDRVHRVKLVSRPLVIDVTE